MKLLLACAFAACALQLMACRTTALEVRPFIRTVLSSRSATDTKRALVEQLQSLRASEDSRVSRVEERGAQPVWAGDKASFLDAVLLEVDRVREGFWPMLPYPLPLPSYRVKLATLYRMLNVVLAEEGSTYSTADADRTRRALSILLGQLQAQPGGVYGLEREALRRKRDESSMGEMLQRTPAGLDTPKYTVVDRRGSWEVRQYEPFSVCSTLMDADNNAVGPGAFNSLAGYIFGKNQGGVKMAMTTPVISTVGSDTNAGGATQRKMSFVMPKDLWRDVATAPLPLQESGVVLEQASDFQGRDLAVAWFGGYCRPRELSSRVNDLRTAIAESGDWTLPFGAAAVPLVMQYNDPFQPPWRRRNEVAFAVERRERGG